MMTEAFKNELLLVADCALLMLVVLLVGRVVSVESRRRPEIMNRYGWIPQLPDHRDIAYKVAAPVKVPARVDLRKQCPPDFWTIRLVSG